MFKKHSGDQLVCLPLRAISCLVSVLLASNVLGLILFVCLLDDCHRAKALIIDLQTLITWSLVNFQYLRAETHSLQQVIKPFVLSYYCNCSQSEPKLTGLKDRGSSLSESHQRLRLEIHCKNQHCIRCMPCCDLMMRALTSVFSGVHFENQSQAESIDLWRGVIAIQYNTGTDKPLHV